MHPACYSLVSTREGFSHLCFSVIFVSCSWYQSAVCLIFCWNQQQTSFSIILVHSRFMTEIIAVTLINIMLLYKPFCQHTSVFVFLELLHVFMNEPLEIIGAASAFRGILFLSKYSGWNCSTNANLKKNFRRTLSCLNSSKVMVAHPSLVTVEKNKKKIGLLKLKVSKSYLLSTHGSLCLLIIVHTSRVVTSCFSHSHTFFAECFWYIVYNVHCDMS